MENSITRPRSRRRSYFKEALMSSWGIKKDQDGTLDAAARIPNWDYRRVLQSVYHTVGIAALLLAVVRGIPISTESFIAVLMSERMKNFWVSVAKEALAPPTQEESSLAPQVDKSRPFKRVTRRKPTRTVPKVTVPKGPSEEGAVIVDHPTQSLSSARIVSLEQRRSP